MTVDGVMPLAIAKVSENEKTGVVVATYAAQPSCPTSCVFLNGGGCYAEHGFVGMHTKRLNEAAAGEGAGALDVARAEAEAIDAVKAVGWPMRLHVVGDAASGAAALIVARAAERFMARGGGPVWTYTHGWRDVSRAVWGRVSVLASCESPADVVEARRRGYAAAIVVPRFPSWRRFSLSSGGDTVQVVPCPAQTKPNVTCSSCQLCMDDGRLKRLGVVIGFEVHGTAFTVTKAQLALERPDDPVRRLSSRVRIPALLAERPGLGPKAVAGVLGISQGSAWEMMKQLRSEGLIP